MAISKVKVLSKWNQIETFCFPSVFLPPENVVTLELATFLEPICQNHRLTMTSDTWISCCKRKNRKNRADTRNRFDVMSTKAKQYHPRENSLGLSQIHARTYVGELSLVETSKFVEKHLEHPLTYGAYMVYPPTGGKMQNHRLGCIGKIRKRCWKYCNCICIRHTAKNFKKSLPPS